MSEPTRTRIDAAHIIAYDTQAGEHRYLRDGVIVVEGDTVIHVGKTFDGHTDERVDATSQVVTPGFVNVHAHLAGSPLDKSFIEDRGPRQFYLSGLFELLPARGAGQDAEATQACFDYSMIELLRTGTTTILEMGPLLEEAIPSVVAAGLRLYFGPAIRDGRWYTDNGRTVRYDWDEAAGRAALRRAVEFIERHDGAHDGLIKGFLSPLQVDTCTADLLREVRREADRLHVPVQIHVSQSVNEFQEMVARHGQTPIEWLESLGFLAPDVLLGHAIILGGGSWANYQADDLGIIARSGATVAHSSWVFARRGIALESFSRYLAAGVPLALGTDTAPQSMLEAMKFTAVVSKIVDRQTEVATAAEVFTAATLGGARAIGRDDLGRIAPGAKADLLFFDTETLWMTPLRDPVKNIVYSAQAHDLADVMVNGRVVMRDRRVLGLDERDVVRRLQAGGERMWPAMARGHWDGRDADTLSPQSFPLWQG